MSALNLLSADRVESWQRDEHGLVRLRDQSLKERIGCHVEIPLPNHEAARRNWNRNQSQRIRADWITANLPLVSILSSWA